MEDDYAIGISLGSTYSYIGVYKNGQIEIIPDSNGEKATPSFLIEYNRIRKSLIKNHVNNDNLNEKDYYTWLDLIKYFDYDISEERMDEIQEILQKIIKNLISKAYYYLKKEIKKIVVAVPPYYNKKIKMIIYDFLKKHKLELIGIISEPIASALSFTYNEENLEEPKKILVIDLGAENYDVSILELKSDESDEKENEQCYNINILSSSKYNTFSENFDNSIFESKSSKNSRNNNCKKRINIRILSSSENNNFGGKHFDNNLLKYIINNFNEDKSNKIKIEELESERLRADCEEVKKALSELNEITVKFDNFYENIDIYEKITRKNFIDICGDIHIWLEKEIYKALSKANLEESDINEVILVGGSMRIPWLKDYFNKRFINKVKNNNLINPEEAIAYGATLKAKEIINEKKKNISEVNIFDKATASLWLSIENQNQSEKLFINEDELTLLIKEGTILPNNGSLVLCGLFEGQTEFLLNIYEGNSIYAKQNRLLKKVKLERLSKSPKYRAKILVEFELDKKRMLHVKASEVSENNGKTIDIFLKNNGFSYSIKNMNQMKEIIERLFNFLKEYNLEEKIAIDFTKIDIEEILEKFREDYNNFFIRIKCFHHDYKAKGDKQEEIFKSFYLRDYINILELFLESFDKNFDNEITSEKFIFYTKRLIHSYVEALNCSSIINKNIIYEKIKKYIQLFIFEFSTFVDDLVDILSPLEKGKESFLFHDLIIFIMKNLNDNGVKYAYKDKEFCKYHSLMYFEKSYSFYEKYLAKAEKKLLGKKIFPILEKEKQICSEFLDDIKSGSIIFSQECFHRNSLYNVLLDSFPPNDIWFKSINFKSHKQLTDFQKGKFYLKEFENILFHIQKASKQTKKEALCIANILKLNYELDYLNNSKIQYLINLAHKCNNIINELKLNKDEKWIPEFFNLFEKLKDIKIGKYMKFTNDLLKSQENSYKKKNELNEITNSNINLKSKQRNYCFKLLKLIEEKSPYISFEIKVKYRHFIEIFEPKSMLFFYCMYCYKMPEIILKDNKSLIFICNNCKAIKSEIISNVFKPDSKWISYITCQLCKLEFHASIAICESNNLCLCRYCIDKLGEKEDNLFTIFLEDYYFNDFIYLKKYINNNDINSSFNIGKNQFKKFISSLEQIQEEKYDFVKKIIIQIIGNDNIKKNESKKIIIKILDIYFDDFETGQNLINFTKIFIISFIVYKPNDLEQQEKIARLFDTILDYFSIKKIEEFKNSIISLKNKFKNIYKGLNLEEIETLKNYINNLFKFHDSKYPYYKRNDLFIEDSIKASSILEKYTVLEKEKNPDNFIDIDKTLNENDNFYGKLNNLNDPIFILSLFGKCLQNKGIKVNITKEKDETFKDIEIASIQSLFSLYNYKKYELHFDFGKEINQKILKDTEFQESFLQRKKKEIMRKLSISDENFIFTNIHEGCVGVHASFLNCNEQRLQQIIYNLREINEIIKIDETPIIEILQISPFILDHKGNRYKGWGINEKRGGEKYIPPINEWYGIGLSVEGKYDNGDNKWLDYNNNRGEYAIAYIGINNIYNDKDTIINDLNILQEKRDIIKNKSFIEDMDLKKKSFIGNLLSIITFSGDKTKKENLCGDGVCVFQNPDYAENSAGYIDVPGYRIKVMLMCRVNPKNIRQPESFPNCWILNPDEIRPYRILIKIIPTSALTNLNETLTFSLTPIQSIIDIINSNDFTFRHLKYDLRFENVAKMENDYVSDKMFAIRLYTYNYYGIINKYLRSRVKPIENQIFSTFTEEEIKSWICCLQCALIELRKNVEENSIVYRGIPIKFSNNLGIGSKLYFAEFLSTSKKKSFCKEWIEGKGTLMKITIKNNGINGCPNYCYYVEDFTMNKGEFEVLISSHCYYTVTNIRRNKDIDYVDLICYGYLLNN